MPYVSSNPTTGKINQTFISWNSRELADVLEKSTIAQGEWRNTGFAQRSEKMHALAGVLRRDGDRLAAIISAEMGKLFREARAEIEKCALGCEYFAHHAHHFLGREVVESDAELSYVSYEPLGVVLAIMPWNFPFWQVVRFAAPALMAGNGGVLKHASNVPLCALAIEQLLVDAGFPPNLFRTLMIESDDIEDVIASRKVQAVTLTGSESAGRRVAELAGKHLLKCVLELGGSDPFIIMPDADLDWTLNQAIASRFLNCGQSCIAAKRFIVMPPFADEFVERFAARIAALKVGDPMLDDTEIAPMARADLVAQLHAQVSDSIAQGAVAVTGCAPLQREGFFYAPSLLDHVSSKTRAYSEELFGPVASVIRARDEDHAISIANETQYGLGASIWTRDTARAQTLAQHIQSGSVFVNGMVKSDPRLPFGGIKNSGFGRELSYQGLREFVNVKTVWVR